MFVVYLINLDWDYHVISLSSPSRWCWLALWKRSKANGTARTTTAERVDDKRHASQIGRPTYPPTDRFTTVISVICLIWYVPWWYFGGIYTRIDPHGPDDDKFSAQPPTHKLNREREGIIAKEFPRDLIFNFRPEADWWRGLWKDAQSK